MALDLSGLAAVRSAAKQRQITLAGVRAAAKVVAPAVKSLAPKVTGALKQSIGQKSAKGRRGKTLAFAVIGARTAVQKEKRLPRSKRVVKRWPAKYAHLVNKGTRHSRAKPFLKPALDATAARAGAAGVAAMAAELDKVLARDAARG